MSLASDELIVTSQLQAIPIRWEENIIGIDADIANLRASLRGATAHAHDLLDQTMRAASGWTSRSDYRRFLSLQHAARMPVEQWIALNAPPAFCPPPQCHLIERDLRALGWSPEDNASEFSLTCRSEGDSTALGVAWVLAGSSLGNRAILKEVKRVAADSATEEWPCSFLGDDAMPAFWKQLRPHIEQSASHNKLEAASRAANAVFDHFLKITISTGRVSA